MNWRKALEEERERERTEIELNRDLWRKRELPLPAKVFSESRVNVLPAGWALASFGLHEIREFLSAGFPCYPYMCLQTK